MRSRRAPAAAGLSDDDGLRAAWHAHAGEMHGYARRVLGDAAAADEAVQEAFLRAWRAAGSYDPARPLRPWLFAILRHVVVDEVRARSARAVPVPEPREAPVAADGAEDLDPLSRALESWVVHEALSRIRPEHRVVLVETYLRGTGYAELASRLGIPEGTARSRAFYGLRALRVALEELGWDG